MSTVLMKLNEKKMWAGGNRREPVCCALCLGELYPGDPYFALEGQRVCEACLERYARRYFAHRRRRLAQREREEP